MKKNPISFLENTFSDLKSWIDQTIEQPKLKMEDDFILKVKKFCSEVQNLSTELNTDIKFIETVQKLFGVHKINKPEILAQHLFFSDCINYYNQLESKETLQSKFVFAYLYDAIINNQFFDENQINSILKILEHPQFNQELKQIRVKYKSDEKFGKSSILLSALEQLKSSKKETYLNLMNQFLQLAFQAGIDVPKAEQANDKNVTPIEETDSIEKVLAELEDLIGLDNIKKDVKELINLLEIQKKRLDAGLKNVDIALHTVFLGAPGTGKTTVARLLGRIFKHLGYLSQGQMIETDREGLVAGFVGQTATKVDEVVQKSIGGVLFIDEAYALTQNTFNDYGAEAINTLLKRMEDNRNDLAVVVAGYSEPMKLFVESNPGLRSRFNRYFNFENFTAEQLVEIFEGFCKKNDFLLTLDAKDKMAATFDLLVSKADESFGNARVARNLFEKIVQNQANRLIDKKKLTPKILKIIEEADIPEPKEAEKLIFTQDDKEEV